MQSTYVQKARLDEAQAVIEIAGRNINNFRYADDTTFMAENEKELKNFLMKVKEESKKVGLELNIQKTEMMVPSLHGKQMGKQWKQWETLLFWAPKSCRWWLQLWNFKKACFLEESYGQPRQHIKKQRHYFANKYPSSQSYGFSSSHVWIWELDYKESWVPKN